MSARDKNTLASFRKSNEHEQITQRNRKLSIPAAIEYSDEPLNRAVKKQNSKYNSVHHSQSIEKEPSAKVRFINKENKSDDTAEQK